MTITEAVAETWLLATGKTNVLTTGTKYLRIIGLLSYFQRRWGRMKGVDWNSLYNPAFSLGTVTATDSFDIDTSSVRKLSDRQGDTVRIVWANDAGYTDYDIVAHDKLKDYYYGPGKTSYTNFVVARVGNQLVFNHTFASTDSQFGGEIFVPCYVFPDAITTTNPSSEEVQVDDPQWLTTRAAAEFDRNDITRRSRYPELKQDAQEIMDRMLDDNEGQIVEVDRPWTPASNTSTDAWG